MQVALLYEALTDRLAGTTLERHVGGENDRRLASLSVGAFALHAAFVAGTKRGPTTGSSAAETARRAQTVFVSEHAAFVTNDAALCQKFAAIPV